MRHKMEKKRGFRNEKPLVVGTTKGLRKLDVRSDEANQQNASL
jgi:hypothetical protein